MYAIIEFYDEINVGDEGAKDFYNKYIEYLHSLKPVLINGNSVIITGVDVDNYKITVRGQFNGVVVE